MCSQCGSHSVDFAWFDHTLYSRLNDKQQGAIVLIMHRLHEDDLVGHVMAQEDWEVVRFPAIAEDEEKQIVDTVWGPKLLTRHRGEVLHPALEPLPMLEHLRPMIGEYNFAGQYQELIAEGLYAVTRYRPQTDKVMRMHAKTAMIENGFIHLPDTAPWLAPYLHELTIFPHGNHDQVDSTAQLLDWYKQGSGRSSNAGIFELYRQRAEEMRRQQAKGDRRVRLRVPAGVGRMNLLHLNVVPDGTAEMLEEEAGSFLRAGCDDQ